MSFWNTLDTRTASGLLARLNDALRQCRSAMRQFSTFGTVSNQLAAAYPALRRLRPVISALESAANDGRSELLNRRQEAIGVPMRSTRRGRKATDMELAQARQDAANELEIARRHIGNARQYLQRAGGRQSLLTQLSETASFLAVAKDAVRR